MGSEGRRYRFRREDLEGILSRYSPALYRMALRQLGNHEDAEDAVQDALLSAFTHISQFEGRSHISTWLHRIVINSARMQLRRRHGRTFLSLDDREDGNSDLERQFIDSGLSPQQRCERAELRAIVQQLLRSLSPKLRNALQLRHIDGLSTDESARALGVTRSTVKSRARRGRTELGMLLVNRGLADASPYDSSSPGGATS